jgi:hypothetical protein
MIKQEWQEWQLFNTITKKDKSSLTVLSIELMI